jgi:hypothetical protein
MGKLTKITSASTIILLIVLIAFILIALSFKGYSECACTSKFNNATQTYYTDCKTHGPGFWSMVGAGYSGTCPVCACPQGYILENGVCNPQCYYSTPACLSPSIECS